MSIKDKIIKLRCLFWAVLSKTQILEFIHLWFNAIMYHIHVSCQGIAFLHANIIHCNACHRAP